MSNKWKVIDLYFKNRKILYEQQYECYHFFVDTVIPTELKNYNVIDEHEDIDKQFYYEMKFLFDNISVRPATLDNGIDYVTPMTARYRGISYMATIIADVKQVQYKTNLLTGETTLNIIEEQKDVHIAKIPIMVKSKYCTTSLVPETASEECIYDPGCYFIINGNEKVVLCMERAATNKIFVFGKDNEYKATINAQRDDIDGISYTSNFTIKLKSDGTLVCSSNHFSEIPLMILLRSLGLQTDFEITMNILQSRIEDDLEMNNYVMMSLFKCLDEKGNYLKTVDETQNFMMSKISNPKIYSTEPEVRLKQKKSHLLRILSNEFLPHLENDMLHKARFVCLMTNKLLKVAMKRAGPDDRDTFLNKRIEMPGVLLAQLFRQAYKKMMNECSQHFRKKNIGDENPLKIINQIKPTIIEQLMKSALLTGIWGMSKTKNGVARVLERLSYLQSISQFRRVISPTVDEKNSKITSMRNIHPSQMGYLCVVETPEGEKVGLVKNLALMTSITTPDVVMNGVLKSMIKENPLFLPFSKLQIYDYSDNFKIFVNGDWLGFTKKPKEFYDKLIELKLNNKINRYTGICFDIDDKSIRILSDGGRMVRPLLRVNQNEYKPYLTQNMIDDIDIEGFDYKKISNWDDFILKNPNVVEYIDIEQAPYTLISMYDSDLQKAKQIREGELENDEVVNRYFNSYNPYTHMEFHPLMNLGMTVANIPFCNMNQAPRNVYQYAQAKQAMGIYTTNWRNRFDISNILYHPQMPIVSTRAGEYTATAELSNGENVIVAIACYTGYNQEDSVVLNATSVARGLFRSTYVKKYNSTIEKNQVSSQDDIHAKPDKNLVLNIKADVNYEKLNDRGFVEPETVVENGDAIIGKISPIQPTENSSKVFKDKSEIYKGYQKATIDKVQTGIINQDGYEMYNMRIRSERVPQVGDKLCCGTPDHDVLTDKGWIPIPELTLEHKVATLVDGSRLEYHHPTALQEFDHKGKMYEVKSEKVNLCVTPNHRMYVGNCHRANYRIELAEEIYGKMRAYRNNVDEWKPENPLDKFVLPGVGDLPDLELPIEEWCIFFGIWIAEGCTLRDWGLSFATHKERVKEALIKINEKCNFDVRYHKDKSDDEIRNAWCYPDKRLVAYIHPMSVGAGNKTLPDWCFNLSVQHTQSLIHGMMLGDGHTMKNGTMRYDTSSIKLANDFQRLCLHAGWAASISLKAPSGTCNHAINGKPVKQNFDAWRLTIIRTQNKPLVNKYLKTGKQQDSWVDYEGKVYCCTVPSGIFYVRRGGKPIWTGNSRSGQKGTCGILLKAEDMPFTEDGIVPDMIINPNCIPGRMTIGQLLELVYAKSGAILGEFKDGTPFEPHSVEDICNELESLGYNKHGYETMYSGISGKKLKAQIFVGPTFYQRLKHMVADKIHARATGPTVMMTRQPPEGRTKNGGLRFGEMERDVAIAHGMGVFLKERMMECSDLYEVHVCGICGMFASKMKTSDTYHCIGCNNSNDISKIQIPYAFKLMIQELMAINILPRIQTEKND
jgi:DNA-directed RNA polymerase II subunit RPB2